MHELLPAAPVPYATFYDLAQGGCMLSLPVSCHSLPTAGGKEGTEEGKTKAFWW